MIKIIKEGKPKEEVVNPEIRKECGYCNTIFTYQREDVNADFRDGPYVICPNCEHFLNI
jgi:hypothetical protein